MEAQEEDEDEKDEGEVRRKGAKDDGNQGQKIVIVGLHNQQPQANCSVPAILQCSCFQHLNIQQPKLHCWEIVPTVLALFTLQFLVT